MNEWLSTIRDQLSDHGIKIAVAAAFTILGWLFGRWKAARDWRRREFFNRLNISLNAILNEISEKFSAGLFLREAARPHDAIRYLFCLTNECDGDVRTRKIRAMVIRRDRLLNLPAEQPSLESPHHSVRWKTLQHMQKTYATDPSLFLDVEILV